MTGTLPTDFRFTGQRNQGTIKLYDYHARFYDPYLNRFIQADTIVPEPGNPQTLNRYSHVNNRPLVYLDPSGHQPRTPEPVKTPEPPLTVTPQPTPVPSLASYPAYLMGRSEARLLRSHLYQGKDSNDCALTSIAMVINTLAGGDVVKDQIVDLADYGWLIGQDTRIFPGQGVPPNQQVNVFNLVGHMEHAMYGDPLSVYAARGTMQDLRRSLQDPNMAVIVSIQWERGKLKTGHAMVLAAYDPAHRSEDEITPWGFLDPAQKDPDSLRWFSTADFQKLWDNWGTQRIPFMIDVGGSNMVVVNLIENGE